VLGVRAMNAITKPSTPDPLQASSAPRAPASADSSAVRSNAPTLASAVERISFVLEHNPGRLFSRPALADRLSVDERLVYDALLQLRAGGFIHTVTTAERGMNKFRYQWKDCPL
jgi:hypothetical protein